MGCFCRRAVGALDIGVKAAVDIQVALPQDELLLAVNAWLSARMLPAAPWLPDLAWLELEIPEPPMPSAAIGIVLALVQAHASALALGLDLTLPDHVFRLSRIVATLNLRLPALEAWLELDLQPWELLANLNDQADAVIRAAGMGVFLDVAVEEEFDLTLWRPLILKLKALGPLIAIGQMLKIDAGLGGLGALLRVLCRVVLPRLENPLLVLRIIARIGALARIQASFGVDPRTTPFARVSAAVSLKVQKANLLLPLDEHLQAGVLLNLPARLPNPGQLVNVDIIAAVRSLTPEVLLSLRWSPPAFDQFDLLTAAVPAMTLGSLMATIGPPAICIAPCDLSCDAATVGRKIATAASPIVP